METTVQMQIKSKDVYIIIAYCKAFKNLRRVRKKG